MLFKSLVSLTFVALAAAQATKGKAFDHIFIIFLENTDFDKANTDAGMNAFYDKGIVLENYSGVTHPSEPNYVAVSGGDYFGMSDDDLYYIPENYTTIVDLLEKKNLTWRTYQENMPTPCYTGFNYTHLYQRKHNPFIIYDSIANNTARCSNVVPATQLATDLANNELPNYAFYTPNMNNDGHDTTVANASSWLNGFLNPLLNNTAFNNNTLVVVTFDETETYTIPNRVLTLLLGDVVDSMKNTTDSTFYTHYSLLSTVEQNWDLGNLGRQDANATVSNVFDFVAKATGYTNVNVTNPPTLNYTYPGFLFNGSDATLPYNGSASTGSSSGSGSGSGSGSKSAADNTAVPKVVVAFAALAGAVASLF
ncbi:hypothetical protein BGZ49_006152 [Haplosporangium sp. Z 27]|nr:hypothetical protein BGZ49_006152 [Haplosporangium sp. Z 27]